VPKSHIIEGRSLQPWLHNEPWVHSNNHSGHWRTYCVSEYDYSTRDARRAIGVDQNDARLVMVFDGRWKYIHVEHMQPMLFDLQSDPDELINLGDDDAYKAQLDRLANCHFEWSRQHHNRTTMSEAAVEKMTDGKEPPGILIGFANRGEVEQEGRKLPPHVKR